MENAMLETVLDNVDIRCAGTAEVVYYGNPLSYVFHAAYVLAFAEIFYLFGGAGTVTVRIFAQYSVDGETWTNFATELLTSTATGTVRGTRNVTIDDFGPFVRYNVGIVNSSAVPAAARLTAKVKTVFWSGAA